MKDFIQGCVSSGLMLVLLFSLLKLTVFGELSWLVVFSVFFHPFIIVPFLVLVFNVFCKFDKFVQEYQ